VARPTGKAEKARRLRHGLPNFKLVRYADDWRLMIKGNQAGAEALRNEIARVLSTKGLRLSEERL
jgi:RNA-directed DNA polymerase